MKKALLNPLQDADTSLICLIWYYHYLKLQIHCTFICICTEGGDLPREFKELDGTCIIWSRTTSISQILGDRNHHLFCKVR